MFGVQENTRPEAFFLPKYLDVPIVTTELNLCELYLHNCHLRPMLDPKRIPPRVKGVCDALMKHPLYNENQVSRITPSDYPALFREFTRETAVTDRYSCFTEATCAPILRALESYYLEQFNTVLNLPSGRMDDPICLLWLGRMLWWNSVVGKYDEYRSTGGRNHKLVTEGEAQVLMSTGLCCIIVPGGASPLRILSYDAFIGLKDALYVRFNVLLARYIVYSKDLLLTDLLLSQWDWQELCLLRYGNEGYELAKSTESLTKTYGSWLSDSDMRFSTNSYENMCAKHQEKEKKICITLGLSYPTTWCWVLYEESVLKRCASLTQVFELFGVQKAVMHPDIDVTRGGLSAAGEARSADPTHISDALALRATFCRLFCEGYIRKHGRWPPLSNTTRGTRLHDYFSTGILAASRHDIPETDWALVSFEKIFEFDCYPNFLEIIDDKSINVKYSERCSAWDRQVITTSERRMILEVLKREEIDHAKFISYIDEWILEPDWFTVALTPKEREFKLAARMFAMMVLELRNAATIIEANLAEKILPYMPQLTMVDDKLTVHQRLLQITTPVDKDTILRLFLELDLSRWNLRWRELTVHMVGKDINGLFGVSRLFTWIHKYFSQCMIYVRSANLMPKDMDQDPPPESDLLWLGQFGGLEGLAQKLWSICTVAMEARGLEDLDGSYTMTAQGDNVMLTVTVPRDRSLSYDTQYRRTRDWITARSALYAAKVNQELKPEECVDSCTTVTYSKAVYVNGVDYPLTLKALSRIFPTTSVDFPSIDAYLSAMYASGLAASESAKDPLTCYAVTIIQVAFAVRLLRYSGGPYASTLRRLTLGQDPAMTRLALMLPASLGGYSTSGFVEFMYRGGGDPVSKGLGSCYCLRYLLPEAGAVISRLQAAETYQARPRLEDLIKDPYSLPCRKLAAPADAVTETTLEVVRTAVRNKDIKEVLDLASPAYEKDLVSVLGTMKPFNPVIAHDLYDCSILGTQEAIRKMFLTTRSVQALAKTTGAGDLSSSLIDAAISNLYGREELLRSIKLERPAPGTLYSMVEKARSYWDKSGVVVRGITSYTPVDFPCHANRPPFPEGIHVVARHPLIDPRFTRGPEKAYVGVRTREKRADHGYKLIGKGYAKSALMTLQRIYSWSSRDRGMAEFIDHLALTRSTIRISSVTDLLTTVVGGSASHRYANRVAASSAHIMGQSTFASHCYFDSDHAGFLSATEDDYPVMFQEFFLWMLAQADIIAAASKGRVQTMVSLQIGDKPLVPLEGDRFSLDSELIKTHDFKNLPRLVRDPSIHMKKDVYTPLFDLVPIYECDQMSARFRALDELLVRSLRGASGVSGLLDNVYHKVTIPLGLLELRNMGLAIYLQSCARVILSTCTDIQLFRMSPRGRPVSPSYVTFKIGKALIEPILRIVVHPEMRDDPTVRRCNLYVTPRYMNKRILETTLLGELHRVLEFEHGVHTSSYYRSPVIIFSDTSLDEQILAILARVKQLLGFTLLEGATSFKECQAALRACSIALNRATTMPRDQGLALLTTVFGGLDGVEGIPKLKSPLIRDILRRVLLGVKPGKLHVSRWAAEECLRVWRQLRPEAITPYPVTLLPPEPVVAAEMIYTESHSTIPPPTETIHSDKTRLLRHLGVVSPWTSIALHSWYGPLRSLSGSTVLILGSGLGAAAYLCFKSGISVVYGHDLLSDLPRIAHLSSYTPPIVRAYYPRGYYRQTVQSYMTTGDLTEMGILVAVLRDHAIADNILIDLPLPSHSVITILKVISREKIKRTITLRIRQTPKDEMYIVSWVARHYHVIGHWNIYNDITFRETILRVRELRIVPLVLPKLVEPVAGHTSLSVNANSSLDILGNLSLDVSQILSLSTTRIIAPLAAVTGGTIFDAACEAYSNFNQMTQERRDHPSYLEWTEILHAGYLSYTLAYLTVSDVLLLIQTQDDFILPLTYTDTPLILHRAPGLIYSLTTVIPMLMPYRLRQLTS